MHPVAGTAVEQEKSMPPPYHARAEEAHAAAAPCLTGARDTTRKSIFLCEDLFFRRQT